MAMKITEIEGIGEATAQKLAEMDITTVEGLLERGSDPKERKAIAEGTGLPAKKVLAFVNMADLLRVKGVGKQYAELLQASGVNTVVELSKRKPENLHPKLVEINEEKKLVRQTPTLKGVTDMVENAKELPRVVEY